MLKGIDISNWQAGISPASLGIDFCICKATEGTTFVDTYCDGFIQECINANILFGYYHFAGSSQPEDEAEFFWNNTRGYTGNGIPVLDYESWDIWRDHVEWCETFLDEYHERSNVWPMLYISASHCAEFDGSWIPKKCGLWVAGYNRDYPSWPASDDMPYDVLPWEFAALWQFASDFHLDNYGYELDADLAFMDAAAWAKYAGKSANNAIENTAHDDEKQKTCEQLAKEVLAGKWGTGWNRKHALESIYGEGTYEHVQKIVNDMLR